MSSENFFRAKTSNSFLKTVGKIVKEAIKARVIHVKIMWLSSLKKFNSDTCN